MFRTTKINTTVLPGKAEPRMNTSILVKTASGNMERYLMEVDPFFSKHGLEGYSIKISKQNKKNLYDSIEKIEIFAQGEYKKDYSKFFLEVLKVHNQLKNDFSQKVPNLERTALEFFPNKYLK